MPDKQLAGKAKAASLLVFVFLLVLGSALWSFLAYQATRKAELEQQFARSAARLGQQVELRYENDRQIIENVMRVLSSAQNLGTEQRSDELNKARIAVAKKSEREADARVRAAASQYLLQLIGSARQAVNDAAIAKDLSLARTAAEAWAKAAQAALVAENHVDVELLNRADQAVAGDAAGCDLAAAERMRERAQATIVSQQEQEHAAYLGEKEARERALASWHQAKARLEPQASPTSSPSDVLCVRDTRGPPDGAKSLAEVEASLAHEQAAEQGLADPSAAHDAATSIKERDAARDLRRRLNAVVLPSYEAAINQCPSNAGLQALALCAARKLAELNAGLAAGVEVVRCSSATDPAQPPGILPTLSEDGQYVLLPASEMTDTPLRVCGRVRVEQLLAASQTPPPFAPRPMFAPFDAVALLQDDGSALFVPATDSNVRLSSLKLDKGASFASSSMVPDVPLGAGKYRAFVQPLKVVIQSRGKTTNLVVAGFLPELDLTRQSMEIGLSSYLWVVLLLGVGLLSLPLAKLWLLGRTTSFTRFDVTLLLTSSLLTVLLAVVLLLSFVAHNRLWFRAGEQTKQVATELQAKLKEAVSGAARNLVKLQQDTNELTSAVTDQTSPVEQNRLARACSGQKGRLADNVLYAGDHHRWSVCEVTNYRGAGLSGDWKLAFWANSLGYEQVKFVPSGHASVPVGVKERRYFRQAMNDQTGCLAADCKQRFAAEVVRSVTSGETVLVAAQRIPTGSGGMVAIQTPMNQFQRLVLPLGFQAVVIDRDGIVMLHSRDEAAEGQDLFADLDQPTVLRAAIANQMPASIELRYLGVPSRAHVQPLGIPGLGWSVLVFAPFSIVDVATTDMVLASLVGFSGILVLVLACACVWLLFVRVIWVCGLTDVPHFANEPSDRDSVGAPSRRVSFRPNAADSDTYAAAGLWMLRWSFGLCVIALLSEGWLPTTPQLVLNALVALLALTHLMHNRRKPERFLMLPDFIGKMRERYPASAARQGQWRARVELTYALCCFGLAAIFVVTPTTIIFAGSYDLVVDVLARAEESHLAAGVSGNVHLLAGAQPASDQGADSTAGRIFAPPHSGGPPLPIPDGTHCAFWPMPCLADFLPPLGCPENQVLGRLYQSAVHPPTPPFAGRYDLRRHGSQLQAVATSSEAQAASVALPTLRTTEFQGLKLVAVLVVFAIFFCAALGTTIQTLRRLFFLDRMFHPDGLSASELDVLGQKALVTFADPELEAALRTRGFVNLPQDVPAGGSAKWLVPRLETLVGDAAAAEWLNAAARNSEAVVVLLCSGDPMLLELKNETWVRVLSVYQVFQHACAIRPPLGSSHAVLAQAWLDCSEHERQALAQLAIDGYVNPHVSNRPVVDRLVRRGILDCQTLSIHNLAFEESIRHSVTSEQRRAWQEADKNKNDNTWQAIRAPLFGVVVALFSAIAMSKPELGAASAVVPTLTASLPAVVKILLQMLSPRSAS